MRKLYILLCIAFIISCGGNSKKFDSTVNFEKIKIERNSSDISEDTTYQVSITYYKPVDAQKFLNDSINKYTKILFASWFDVSGNNDLNASVKKHMDEYFKEVEKNRFFYHHAFYLKIDPDESYQNNNMLSFAYNWGVYEGGAHGNHGKYCFMLDKRDGSKITYNKLVKPEKEEEFLKIAEDEFRNQAGVKEGEKMPDLYRFENNKFHLNDNFALTPAGLAFYYNPYDIAPYTAGLIKLILPYEKIKGYINFID